MSIERLVGSSAFFMVKRVSGQGPEQRESEKAILYLQIIIILISYIILHERSERSERSEVKRYQKQA